MISHGLLKPMINKQDYAFELNNPILKQTFMIDGYCVLVILTKNYLFFHQMSPTPKFQVLLLQFKLKFQVQHELYSNFTSNPQKFNNPHPCAIIFQTEQSTQKLKLQSNHYETLNQWIKHLRKRINQRDIQFHYQLTNQSIGKGSFGSVQLVRRKQDGMEFAVKKFDKKKQYALDKGRQSLENQIKILRHVNHPNIIKLEAVYQSSGYIYMVMQYVSGGNLLKAMKNKIKQKRKFTQQQISKIAFNILKALQYLASQNIAHRDIKLDNILLRKDSSEVVICDFGLATFTNLKQYIFIRCGTPGYVAPQILNYSSQQTYKCDLKCDMFSFGIILDMLLTQASIYQTQLYKEVLAQNRLCQFSFEKDKYNGLPKSTLHLLRKMLAKDPSKRISVQRALRNPYFKQNLLKKKLKYKRYIKLSSKQANSYQTCSQQDITNKDKNKIIKKDCKTDKNTLKTLISQKSC